MTDGPPRKGPTAPSTPRPGGRLALLLLAIAALPACLNFQEPEELPPRDAELSANVTVTDSTPATADVQGRLLRPRGEDGRLVPLADPGLRILGRSVTPAPGEDDDLLLYRAEWTLTPAERGSDVLALEGPAVEPGGARVSVVLPFIKRAGPDSLALVADEELRLPLDRGREAAYGNVSSLSWQLVVAVEGSETSLVITRASGRPPDTLRVQRELVETAPQGEVLEVQVWTRLHARRLSADLPYPVQFDASTVVEWQVTVE